MKNHEADKFTLSAEEWWDVNGPMRMLHVVNPLRLQYIIDHIERQFSSATYINDSQNIDQFDLKCQQSMQILDIGCGGGLITIPLLNLGYNVMALDLNPINTQNVSDLWKGDAGLLRLFSGSIEAMSLEHPDAFFDVVLAMDVIEHVGNPESFLSAAWDRLKPGGIMIISTFNKTIKSWLQGICLAEHILRWLPIGTHNWKKFYKPSFIYEAIAKQYPNQVESIETRGLSYSPFRGEWRFSDDIEVNYLMTLKKRG